MKNTVIIFVLLMILSGVLSAQEAQGAPELRVLPDWTLTYREDELERAVFAGGCFWGVEAVFEQLTGVVDVRSGYSGGREETASYYAVGSGTTGHAEAVEILFDPEQISYRTLLEVFFTVAHDPTQYNYQGPDHGPQYRSAVFFSGRRQKSEVQNMIRKLEREKLYDTPIVTEVAPLDRFYPAEEYHQDFMRLHPYYPYIVHWDRPKIFHLQNAYPDLLAP